MAQLGLVHSQRRPSGNAELDHPYETIADAVIDLSGTEDIQRISEITGYAPNTIDLTIADPKFHNYLYKRLIQRGFDGTRYMQKANIISHYVLNELARRVSNRKLRKNMDAEILLAIESVVQKTLQQKIKNETAHAALRKNQKSEKRLLNPEEAKQRLLGIKSDSPLGKYLLLKSEGPEVQIKNTVLPEDNKPEDENES